MTSAPARDRHHAPPPVRDMLALVLGPDRCITCLEPVDSALRRELCEVDGG